MFDYHRQHAPVSGKVMHAEVLMGAAYLEVVAKDEKEDTTTSSPAV